MIAKAQRQTVIVGEANKARKPYLCEGRKRAPHATKSACRNRERSAAWISLPCGGDHGQPQYVKWLRRLAARKGDAFVWLRGLLRRSGARCGPNIAVQPAISRIYSPVCPPVDRAFDSKGRDRQMNINNLATNLCAAACDDLVVPRAYCDGARVAHARILSNQQVATRDSACEPPSWL